MKRDDLGDLALAAEGASSSVPVVPRNAAALDRVPRQAISTRLVQGGEQDRSPSSSVDHAQEEAPVVPGGKVVGVPVDLPLRPEAPRLRSEKKSYNRNIQQNFSEL